jgi:hypothetical protein
LLLPISEPENQSLFDEKVLFITKKTENRVKKSAKSSENAREIRKKKSEWQKMPIFRFSS